jgi:membrane protease YdiL (CAAX protease family)
MSTGAMSVMSALAWTTAAWFGLQGLVSGVAALRPGVQSDIVTLGGAAAIAFLLSTFGVLSVHARGLASRQALALRPTHPALLAIGVGLGVSLKLPAESLREVMEGLFPSNDAELLRRATLFRSDTLTEMLGLLIVVCLVGPLVEELFFRGALYGRMARASAPLAAATTGILFVLTHTDFRAWPSLVVVSCALSFLRMLGGSLLPCIALHVAFNTVGVLALVTHAASAMSPMNAPLPLVLSSWFVAGVLILALVRLSDHDLTARARAEDEA